MVEKKNGARTVLELQKNSLTILRVTGSPRRGCSDSEGPEKRNTPIPDLFVREGAKPGDCR